jgi:tetrahydromethanopterin S-methyltransferase subunit C
MPDADTELSVAEFIAHPAATITAAVGVLSGWVNPLFDPVVAVVAPAVATVWAQAGAIFTVTSIGSTTLAPELGWLPSGPLTIAAIAAGAVFAANRLYAVYQGYKDQT